MGMIIALNASAQPSSTPNFITERKSALSDAEAALKRGDSNTALARLQGQVRRGAGVSHEDVQIGQLLCSVACQARSVGDGGTSETAITLLLARLAQPNGRMSIADSVAALSLTGEACELRGDSIAAINAYQQALALMPSQAHVKARLAHLTAVDRHAKLKEEANAMLQRRAQNKKS